MRFLGTTIVFIIGLSMNITHAQSWQSIKQFKIDSRDGASINFIETDPNGDLIIGGTFYSKFTTDSRTYNSYNGVGAFVLKLNDNNDIVWEHVWQGDNSMFDNTGLTGDIDSDGNIYLGLSGLYQTATYSIDPALDDRMIKINNEGSILSTQSFSNSTVFIVDLEVENGQIASWNQIKVKNRVNALAPWVVRVEHDGEYEISIRRWPAEADKAINDKYLAPKSYGAQKAFLKIAGIELEQLVHDSAKQITFKLKLKKGQYELLTGFENQQGVRSAAFYAYVLNKSIFKGSITNWQTRESLGLPLESMFSQKI